MGKGRNEPGAFSDSTRLRHCPTIGPPCRHVRRALDDSLPANQAVTPAKSAGDATRSARQWSCLSTSNVRVALRFRNAVLLHKSAFFRRDLLATGSADDALRLSEEHRNLHPGQPTTNSSPSRGQPGSERWGRQSSAEASLTSLFRETQNRFAGPRNWPSTSGAWPDWWSSRFTSSVLRSSASGSGNLFRHSRVQPEAATDDLSSGQAGAGGGGGRFFTSAMYGRSPANPADRPTHRSRRDLLLQSAVVV